VPLLQGCLEEADGDMGAEIDNVHGLDTDLLLLCVVLRNTLLVDPNHTVPVLGGKGNGPINGAFCGPYFPNGSVFLNNNVRLTLNVRTTGRRRL